MKNLQKISRTIILSFVILFIFSGNIFAAWCQGKPLPEQKTFWVFETAIKKRLTNNQKFYNDNDFLLTFETGYMKNISPKTSVGGTMYLGADDDGSVFGLKFRYRYWLNRQVSIDLSPGLILSSSYNNMIIKKPSFLATASIGLKDLIAFDVQFQALKYQSNYYNAAPTSRTKTDLYMGVRLGSEAAVVGTAVVIVAGLIALSQTDMNFGSSY